MLLLVDFLLDEIWNNIRTFLIEQQLLPFLNSLVCDMIYFYYINVLLQGNSPIPCRYA